MGKFSRLSTGLRSRVNRLLDDVSDSDDLDRAYEEMHGRLRDVERGVTDVATERKRLEERIEQLQSEVERHNDRAREAVADGDDDAAREELASKNRTLQRIERLEGEVEDLRQAEEELLERRDDLAERVEEFRTEKEQLKARKRTAEAKADAAEATGGAGSEDATRRAEAARDDVADAEARAAAMEELEREGVFDGPLTPDDEIEEELDDVESREAVDSELETIRAEIDERDQNGDDDEE